MQLVARCLEGRPVIADSLIDARRRKLVEQLRKRAQQQEPTVLERPKLIVVKGGKDNAE
jgi:hypothetical protein